MQSVSNLYKSLVSSGASVEIKAVISGNTYGQGRIISSSGESKLLSKAATIGNCIAKTLSISLLDAGNIPRAAKIRLESRMTDGNQYSEWIKKGSYFVDTRSDSDSNVLVLNAFDAMLKADQPYLENSELSDWPANENDVVAEIAELMGVSIDPRTVLAGYSVPIPEQDWTCKEMLGWIGASNCGNWTITPADELYLVPFGGITSLLSADYNTAILMGNSILVLSTEIAYGETRQLLSKDTNTAIRFGDDYIVLNGEGNTVGSIGKTYQDIQKNAESFDNLGMLPPFSGIKLWRSHETTYVDELTEIERDGESSLESVPVEVEQSVMAGDDTGRVLEADCPWATQAMVDNILPKIVGYCYQAATVQKALVSPALELGDTCICNGITFPVCQIVEDYADQYAPTISSPEDEQIDYEYRYTNTMERQLKRKLTLNQNYYGFKVTREHGIEVTNIVDGVETTRMVLNSSTQAFYNSNGDVALYFDAEAGQYKFVGDVTVLSGSLNINDNFIVDTDGNVTCNGSVILQGSDTKIKAPLIMSDSFAVFPEDATDVEIEALTIPAGFNLYGRESGDLYNFLTIYQYGTHTHLTNGQNSATDLNINYPTVNFDGNSLYHYGSGYTGSDAAIATVGKVKDLITNGW